MIKVLSIDGGGIRGIIPAVVLYEIENRTGKPISELFDLIAGTSTGGILALGLTKPDDDHKPQYTAEQLIDLYATEGRGIFSRSIWHRMRALDDLIEEKYPSKGVDAILHKYLAAQPPPTVTRSTVTVICSTVPPTVARSTVEP